MKISFQLAGNISLTEKSLTFRCSSRKIRATHEMYLDGTTKSGGRFDKEMCQK